MSLTHLVRVFFFAALFALATAATTLPSPALAQASVPAADTPAPAPTVIAAPATVDAPTNVVSKEEVTNPYGMEALWRDGDIITRSTLIIMIIMSMGSWYIIFTKLFEQSKLMKSAKQAGDGFWAAGSIKKGAEGLDERSAFRFIAESGLKASDHHEGTLVDTIDKHTWIGMSMQRAVDNINSRLQDGLAFLATVGSTAPFVGLFGTVWGILHALTSIGTSGQASIDKVAGPVGEALIMTAIGLAVAVPAVMGYNWLIRRNKNVMERVRTFSGDVHNVLLAGKR